MSLPFPRCLRRETEIPRSRFLQFLVHRVAPPANQARTTPSPFPPCRGPRAISILRALYVPTGHLLRPLLGSVPSRTGLPSFHPACRASSRNANEKMEGLYVMGRSEEHTSELQSPMYLV